MTVLPFTAEVMIWGASWSGETGERTALLIEEGDAFLVPMWDRKREQLNCEYLVTRGVYRRVPDRFALLWLTEHLMRSDDFGSED